MVTHLDVRFVHFGERWLGLLADAGIVDVTERDVRFGDADVQKGGLERR